jgi:hypothetical protein
VTCYNTESIPVLVVFSHRESNKGAAIAGTVVFAAPFQLRVPRLSFGELNVAVGFEA